MESTSLKPLRKSFWHRLFGWSFWVLGMVAAVITIFRLVMSWEKIIPDPGIETWVFALIHIFAIVFILTVLILATRAFVRRMSWRTARRAFLGVAGLATLVALFYVVENWRGQRAWEKCKREYKAKGAVLDWQAYIPPPVPDDQNIFKAPKMQEWLVGRGATELSKRPGLQLPSGPLVAEITVISADREVPPAVDLVLNYDGKIVTAAPETSSDDAAKRMIADRLRPVFETLTNAPAGPSSRSCRDLSTFVVQSANSIQPIHILIRGTSSPTTDEVKKFFPESYAKRLDVMSEGSNSFRLTLRNCRYIAAAEYLAWSDQAKPDLDLIREALKRPYARMEGNYAQAYAIPIPNFVTIRMLAQTLADRAKCCFLLGQPEQALDELTFMRDLCRLLEANPTGRPMTLVAAMVNVAVVGLYEDTIAEGLRLGAFGESQLKVLQAQLEQVNLIPIVRNSFGLEQAAMCKTLESTPPAEIAKLFASFSGSKDSFWNRMRTPTYVFLSLAPRGWAYQNMAVHVQLLQPVVDSHDVDRQQILPDKITEAARLSDQSLNHFSPYTYLESTFLPNYTRAVQTLANRQTTAYQAQIVCALECYRRAHGNYPERLDDLSPQFIKKLPHDVIGGQPFRYRRMDEPGGGFQLYSVGWNQTDDGGQVVRNNDRSQELGQGDWAWPPVVK